jgi:hypothetical protein
MDKTLQRCSVCLQIYLWCKKYQQAFVVPVPGTNNPGDDANKCQQAFLAPLPGKAHVNGLRLGSSWTSRKAYKVYFHMDPDSYSYLLWGSLNHWYTTKTFSVHGAASPDFGPMGRVSSGAQQGRVLGFRDDLHHVLVILYPLIYLYSHHEQMGVLFCSKFSHCYLLVDACVG